MTRYGDDSLWGLQSHPETIACEVKSLLLLQKLFRDRKSKGISTALRQKPQDDKIIGVALERSLAVGKRR